jgi:hypothetical protein
MLVCVFFVFLLEENAGGAERPKSKAQWMFYPTTGRKWKICFDGKFFTRGKSRPDATAGSGFNGLFSIG